MKHEPLGVNAAPLSIKRRDFLTKIIKLLHSHGMGGSRHIYWILTIPYSSWSVPTELTNPVVWLKGQHEISETGYSHWQIVCGFATKQSLRAAKLCFPREAHLEPTRSTAAEAYCWKEDTRVAESQFELGFKPVNPACKTDWEMVWQAATAGRIMEIPANIRVQHYRYN